VFLQLLTKNSDLNPHENDGTVKDPKNANSVALLLVALTPAALPLLDAHDPVTMLKIAAPLVCAAIAVWWLIKGLAAEDVWKESGSAEKPKVPFKILGCIALGVAAAALSLVHSTSGLTVAFTQGTIATVLALLAFGLDPLTNKGLDTPTDRALLVVKPMVDSVHSRLDHVLTDVSSLDQEIATFATEDLIAAVNRLTHAVLLDPLRHRIARRHLGVILDGTEQSTLKFMTLWNTLPEPATLSDFVVLADQLAGEYNRAADDYARGGAVSLSVEASVLKDLIRRETP
jgi:hypothetical protein